MKRISVGHLEDVGYKMMFGDANVNKLFKKIDEIDGEEISGRGYIANGGEIAREFYSPLVPLDDGFSFFDEFKKLPPLEDPLAITQPANHLSNTVETEDKLLSLNTFAKNAEISVSTLRNLVKYIEEQDYTFTRADNRIMLDKADISLLEELLTEKEQSGLSYKQVVLEHFTATEPA